MIDILYEDKDILAINKPEGLVAVPERRRLDQSLFEMLCAEQGERLYIVHRIDRETSGVIVFARNAEAHRQLNRQLETRSVEKVYLALVHGVISDARGRSTSRCGSSVPAGWLSMPGVARPASPSFASWSDCVLSLLSRSARTLAADIKSACTSTVWATPSSAIRSTATRPSRAATPVLCSTPAA